MNIHGKRAVEQQIRLKESRMGLAKEWGGDDY
jgi:hypothetical protein